MERLTRRGLMCFEEHPSTLPSPPGLQKCQVLKSTPAFPTNRRKKRGHLCFIGVLTVQRTRSALEDTIQIYSGEVISVSQRCSLPPYGSFATFPFVICVFLVLCFQFFFLPSFIHVLFFHIWHHVVSPLSSPLDVFIQRPLHKRKGNL